MMLVAFPLMQLQRKRTLRPNPTSVHPVPPSACRPAPCIALDIRRVLFLPIFVMLTHYKEALATALRHRDEPIRLEEVLAERNSRKVRKTGAPDLSEKWSKTELDAAEIKLTPTRTLSAGARSRLTLPIV